MDKTYRKDTTVNIPKTKKQDIKNHLKGKPNISYWLCEAIDEKIEREKTMEVPTLQQQLCGPETKI